MSQADVPFERPIPRRPLSIGAGAVVIHQQKVLLVRNLYGVTKARYLLPAGRVNLGEMPDVAAARETFEETHLCVEIEGLLGVRILQLPSGEHNYFFMFRARLLSPVEHLQPNASEVDDARFFSRDELQALSMDETWAGAIAIALKALDTGQNAAPWPNHASLASDSGADHSDQWRIWL